jgi:hypothetical protein
MKHRHLCTEQRKSLSFFLPTFFIFFLSFPFLFLLDFISLLHSSFLPFLFFLSFPSWPINIKPLLYKDNSPLNRKNCKPPTVLSTLQMEKYLFHLHVLKLTPSGFIINQWQWEMCSKLGTQFGTTGQIVLFLKVQCLDVHTMLKTVIYFH